MEEFRVVFVSLGAVGIIGYLVYVALSEVAFRRRR
jgi:preprotein translocase subunit Sss1